MKRKNIELEVGFIGGGRTLTEEDEVAISAYLKAQKKKQEQTAQRMVKSKATRLKRTRAAAKVK
jgi:hypothetical protein